MEARILKVYIKLSFDQAVPILFSTETTSLSGVLSEAGHFLKRSINIEEVFLLDAAEGAYVRFDPSFRISTDRIDIVINSKENSSPKLEQLEQMVRELQSSVNFLQSSIRSDPALIEDFHRVLSIESIGSRKFSRAMNSESFEYSRMMSKKYENKIDIGVLYSSPLVELIGEEDELQYCRPANEPVNFSEECSNILKSLMECHKKIKVHVECATDERFLTIVKSHPTVLHVMCHGSYDVKSQQYYLEFENRSGALLKLTTEKLREFLKGEDLSDIKVIFLNACHSEVLAIHVGNWTSVP